MKSLFLVALLFLVANSQAQALVLAHSLAAPDSAIVEVSPSVYRGPRPTDRDLSYLAKLGVRTDINLQGGDLDNFGLETLVSYWEPGELPENILQEKKQAEGLSLRFAHFPLNSLAPLTASEDQAIDQILELMNSPAARPVFIHCEKGVDRTGLLIALYHLKYQTGWSVDSAYQEWLDLGHGGVHEWFTGDLDTYYFQKAEQILKIRFANTNH